MNLLLLLAFLATGAFADRVQVVPMSGGGGGGGSGAPSGGAASPAPSASPAPVSPSTPAPAVNPGRGRVFVQPQTGLAPSAPRGQGPVQVVPNTQFNPHYYRGHHGDYWNRFYRGGYPYWSRYYADHWWWWDPAVNRWDFWWDGYWWWPGPSGLYLYGNGDYYPYDPRLMEVPPPSAVPPPPPDTQANPAGEPSAPPATGNSGVGTNVWYSPNGQRMVQVAGTQAEAFLYDITGKSPVFMKHLGNDVANVRFTGGVASVPLRIVLEFKDGHSARYNANGKLIR